MIELGAPPPAALMAAAALIGLGCAVALLAGIALVRRADPLVRVHAGVLLDGPASALIAAGLALAAWSAAAALMLAALWAVRAVLARRTLMLALRQLARPT